MKECELTIAFLLFFVNDKHALFCCFHKNRLSYSHVYVDAYDVALRISLMT